METPREEEIKREEQMEDIKQEEAQKEEIMEEKKPESPVEEEKKSEDAPVEEKKEKKVKKVKPKYFIRGFKPNTPFSFGKGPKIGELDLPAVLLWRNFYFSLGALLVGQATFMLLSKFHYPIVTLVGRIIMIQMILGLIYKIGTKFLDAKKLPAIPFESFQIPKELVHIYIEALMNELNMMIAKLLELITFKNVKHSIIFVIVVQIIATIGKKVTLLGMIHFVFTVAMIAPKIYEWQYDMINHLVAKGMEVAQAKAIELYGKIPKSYKAQIEGGLMYAQKLIKEKTE